MSKKKKNAQQRLGFYSISKRSLQTRAIPRERPECWLELLNLLEVEPTRLIYSFSFVLLQCLLFALYRIVLPVLILCKTIKFCCKLIQLHHLQQGVIYNLIHWGMGLFCLPFLARIRLTRNVFRADISQLSPLQKTLVNTSPTLPEPSSGTVSGPDSLGINDLTCISSTPSPI